MLAVLEQISAQLNSYSTSPSFINSTVAARPLSETQPSFEAAPSAVWINALWFSSLMYSLASASIALIVKQWLQHAAVGLSGGSREIARLRQHRLNSLTKWRVGTIVIFLPILLQVALGLFVSGMLILLWTIHGTVAAVISFMAGSLFIFLAAVTLLPVFKWDCCYRSFQAFAVYTIVRFAYNTLRHGLDHLFDKLWRARSISGRARDILELYVFPPVVWIRHRVKEMPTWHGRDQLMVVRNTGLLDRNTVTTAYTTTLSPTFLDRLHIVFSELPVDQLEPSLQDIWTAFETHWGRPFSSGVNEDFFNNVARVEPAALYATRYMAAIDPSKRDGKWKRDTKSLLDKLVTPLGPPRCNPILYISTLSSLSFDNDEVAWTASNKVMEYWIYSEVMEEEIATYAMNRTGELHR